MGVQATEKGIDLLKDAQACLSKSQGSCTRTDIANAASVSEKTVRRFLKGESVSEVNARSICQVLDVPFDTVVEKTEKAGRTKADKTGQLSKKLVGTLRLSDVWFGRDEVVKQLLVPLRDESGPRVLALVGQGGIGKTSLAAKLVEACGVSLRGRRLTADCGFDGVLLLETRSRAGDVVADVLVGLGLDAAQVDTTQRVEQIIRVLQRQRWLVVLDNLEELLYPSDHELAGTAKDAEVGQLLNRLVYELHDSWVVITSRELPGDLGDVNTKNLRVNPKLVRVERVSGIAPQAGAQLLKDLGVRDGDDKLEEISRRVGGHVFVLTQLAAFAVAELDGYLHRYLQTHPELYTDDVSHIL